jgi:integrase
MYQKVDGGVYYVRWMIDGKVFIKSTGKTDKKQAETKRREIMAPYAVGSEVDMLQNVAGRIAGRKMDLVRMDEKKNPALKIAAAWDVYEQTANRPDSGASTLAMYEGQWQRFARWSETHHPGASLRDVDVVRARAYADDLARAKLNPVTFNKHLRLLALVFRSLSEQGRVTINPWERIQRKRAVAHSRRELTVEELRRVCMSATGEMRILFGIGLYSGLRLGDAATLLWSEVDMVRGEIRRVPNKTGRHNPKPVIVPLHPVLAAMLGETPVKARRGPVLPEFCRMYGVRCHLVTDRIQRHLFNNEVPCHAPGTGWQIERDADGQALRTAKGDVVIKQTDKHAVIQVGFHSFRHSFVSLCRAADVPLSVVESIVGHSSPAMTRHYTHTGEVAARSAVNTLPDVTALLGAGQVGEAAEGAAGGTEEAVLTKVARLAEGLTAENWTATRAGLLELLRAPVVVAEVVPAA